MVFCAWEHHCETFKHEYNTVRMLFFAEASSNQRLRILELIVFLIIHEAHLVGLTEGLE